jgi:hypothetical protein
MQTKRFRWHLLLEILAGLWMLFSITYNLLIVGSALDELGDFGSFIAAGIEYRNGNNPYGTSSPLIFEAHFPKFNVGGKLPNLNPPASLLIFQLLPAENNLFYANLWRAISLMVYALSALLLAVHFKPAPLGVLWMFSLAGLWHTIGLGQIYTPLLLVLVLAWISIARGRDLLAGVFLGLLACIKPNFLLLIGILIFLRDWKAIAASTLVFVATSLVPLAFMPWTIYLQWLEASQVGFEILAMPGNSSLTGLTSRLGLPWLGMVLGIFLSIITIWIISFAKTRKVILRETIISAGIVLSLLLSPISWVGYSLFATPIVLSHVEQKPILWISAAMLTVPFNFIMHMYYNNGVIGFVAWGWWYGLALGICMVVLLSARRSLADPNSSVP